MLAERRALAKRAIISLNVWPVRSPNVDIEIAEEHVAELDIGQAERRSCQKTGPSQLGFGNGQQTAELYQRGVDGGSVLL